MSKIDKNVAEYLSRWAISFVSAQIQEAWPWITGNQKLLAHKLPNIAAPPFLVFPKSSP